VPFYEGLSWTPAEYSRGELIIQLKEIA